jgi:hypothetical protein
MVFVDYKKVFDNIQREDIWKSLKKLGILTSFEKSEKYM